VDVLHLTINNEIGTQIAVEAGIEITTTTIAGAVMRKKKAEMETDTDGQDGIAAGTVNTQTIVTDAEKSVDEGVQNMLIIRDHHLLRKCVGLGGRKRICMRTGGVTETGIGPRMWVGFLVLEGALILWKGWCILEIYLRRFH
jgi:hypothetical protein